MIKKNIAATIAILTTLSSFSFSEQTTELVKVNEKTTRRSVSPEDKKLYKQIYSKYEDKFNKLDLSLLENNQELRKQLREENINWKKVETLTKKKGDYRAQKEVLAYQLNNELKSNNLRPAGNRHNNKNRHGKPGMPNMHRKG